MSKKTVYHSKVFDVEEITQPNGNVHSVVVHPGSVALLPLLERDGQTYVILVRQTRVPADNQPLLELPAGTRDPGEEPEVTAKRELTEEIGYTCERLEKLGEFYPAPGISSELMHLFVARDLTPQQGERDEEEADMEIVEMQLDEAIDRARRGDFRDAKTIMGLLLATS